MDDVEPVALEIETFKKFVERFKARYSAKSLPDDTYTMFYEKTCHIPCEEFERVTQLMLGKRSRNFSWFDIVEVHNSLYKRSENKISVEMEKWKEEAKKQDPGKTRVLLKIMAELTGQISKGRIGKDWKTQYAKRMFDLLGRDECLRISTSLPNDGVYGDFKMILLDLLDYRNRV